jgi:hypothetical protein
MLTKQFLVHAAIGPLGHVGTFDTFSGGGVDSDEEKWHPGGMGQTITLGGVSEIDNITISRLRVLGDAWLEAQLLGVGGKYPMIVVKYPLDQDGNGWGPPLIYWGTFKRCAPPEHDSNATDAALIELEMTPATVSLG